MLRTLLLRRSYNIYCQRKVNKAVVTQKQNTRVQNYCIPVKIFSTRFKHFPFDCMSADALGMCTSSFMSSKTGLAYSMLTHYTKNTGDLAG